MAEEDDVGVAGDPTKPIVELSSTLGASALKVSFVGVLQVLTPLSSIPQHAHESLAVT